MSDAHNFVSPTPRLKSWPEGGLLHIRFNNPSKHNALSLEMWEAALAHGFRMPVRLRDVRARGCAAVDPAAVVPWGPRRRTVAPVLERPLKPCV